MCKYSSIRINITNDPFILPNYKYFPESTSVALAKQFKTSNTGFFIFVPSKIWIGVWIFIRDFPKVCVISGFRREVVVISYRHLSTFVPKRVRKLR